MTPKKWIFLGFAALLVAIPLYMTLSSEDILANGKLYKFRLQGGDPFDPFRGKYLRLNYAFDELPIDEKVKVGEEVYTSITVDNEGFAHLSKAYKKPPVKGDYLKTKVVASSWDNSGFRTGRRRFSLRRRRLMERDNGKSYVVIAIPNNMRKYFINEDYAQQGEDVLRAEMDNAYVGIRVLDGECRMEDIYIDKMPLMKYLKKH